MCKSIPFIDNDANGMFVLISDKSFKISKAVELDQSLRNEIKSLESDVDGYEQNLCAAISEAERHKNDFNNTKEDLKAMNEDKREVEEELKNSRTQNAFLLEAKRDMDNENRSLRDEIEHFKDSFARSENKQKELNDTVDLLQVNSNELDEALHDLQSENAVIKRRWNDTKLELDEATKKWQTLSKTYEEEADISEISRKLIEQLRAEVDEIREEFKQSKETVESQRRIIKDVKQVNI